MRKKILWTRNLLWTLSLTALQQLIAASSTILISNLSSAAATGSETAIYLYLGLFAGAIIGSSIPAPFIMSLSQKAKSDAIRNYVKKFKEVHKGTPTQRTNLSYRDKNEPWITTDAAPVINEAIDTIHSGISTSLSIGFNIAALCLSISPEFLIGYSASIIVFPLALKCFTPRVNKINRQAQTARIKLSKALLSAWDNIVIDNRYNIKLWKNRFIERWNDYRGARSKAAFMTQLSSSGTMIIITVPIFGNLIWQIHNNISNTVILIPIIATLPRQMLVIQQIQAVSAIISNWIGAKAKLSSLQQSIEKQELNTDIHARINWKNIKFVMDNHSFIINDVNSLIKILTDRPGGRISIYAENGQGKTTVLNILKQEIGNKAFLLPAHSSLVFFGDQEKSTGQEMAARMQELFHLIDTQQLSEIILLLDEWKANLDVHNSRIIDERLNCISKKLWVVETMPIDKLKNENTYEGKPNLKDQKMPETEREITTVAPFMECKYQEEQTSSIAVQTPQYETFVNEPTLLEQPTSQVSTPLLQDRKQSNKCILM